MFLEVSMIEIKNVSKRFADDVHALKDVSLTINDGEIFGIVGYSGAGKSTLVRLLNQLEKSDSGSILIDDVDINKLKGKQLQDLRKKMGMIFQNFNLLSSRTVKENIELPLELAKVSKQEKEERSKQLLELIGLSEKSDNYPSTLSGGQKQRVAIARALALNPPYLLSDEATSALDPKTADDILSLLKEINSKTNVTIIMITHQMEAVQKICHRLAVMANGEVIEEGKVEDVFRNPQKDLTRQLIQGVDTSLDIQKTKDDLRKEYPEGHLLRISFDNSNSNKPIIYSLAKQCEVPFNIVSANIVNTQAGILGVMYLHIDKRAEVAPFIELLKDNNVLVEVL